MFNFIVPSILIGVSIAGFFMFTNPIYKDIASMRQESSNYNEALNNSKALKEQKEILVKKSNEIGAENLDKLQKLLPSSVDNIRLVLEIEKVAMSYGMSIKDVKYDSIQSNSEANMPNMGIGNNRTISKDYEVLNLEFSTEGTYGNFVNFLKSLENNLRIIDVSSISFSSNSGSSLQDVYKYNFKIKTYWLKN